jgi:hypothetical protein
VKAEIDKLGSSITFSKGYRKAGYMACMELAFANPQHAIRDFAEADSATCVLEGVSAQLMARIVAYGRGHGLTSPTAAFRDLLRRGISAHLDGKRRPPARP